MLSPTTKPEDVAQIESSLLPSLMCHYAVAGDVAAMRELLELGASPQTADYDGRTPLHLAAAGVGCFFRATKTTKKKTKPITKTKLFIDQQGSKIMVQLLLAEIQAQKKEAKALNAVVNAIDSLGYAPLDDALLHAYTLDLESEQPDSYEIIHALRAAGAGLNNDPEMRAMRAGELCVAAARGDIAFLRRYYAAGDLAVIECVVYWPACLSACQVFVLFYVIKSLKTDVLVTATMTSAHP